MRKNWKSKLLLTGTLIGATAGFIATYQMAKNAEKEGREVELTAGNMAKALPAVIGIVRSISAIG